MQPTHLGVVRVQTRRQGREARQRRGASPGRAESAQPSRQAASAVRGRASVGAAADAELERVCPSGGSSSPASRHASRDGRAAAAAAVYPGTADGPSAAATCAATAVRWIPAGEHTAAAPAADVHGRAPAPAARDAAAAAADAGTHLTGATGGLQDDGAAAAALGRRCAAPGPVPAAAAAVVRRRAPTVRPVPALAAAATPRLAAPATTSRLAGWSAATAPASIPPAFPAERAAAAATPARRRPILIFVSYLRLRGC